MSLHSFTDIRIPKVRSARPIALTIAGSDSGGGAGIQADLKTFAAHDVHGTSVITCVTAQNPKAVLGVQPIRGAMVRQQIQAVLAELPPAAIKTGMLYSAAIIRAVATSIRKVQCPIVVDPVMVATSGAILLQENAIAELKNKLFPRATIVTPNLDETEILTGRKLKTISDLEKAARQIHEQFGCAALIKGGHLKGRQLATDVFFDGEHESILDAPFVEGVSTHGTGCTYSAAIAAHLARGKPLLEAVAAAKEFITRAIAESYLAAGHHVLRVI